MAEPGLSVDINTIRREVGLRHGWPRVIGSWTNTQHEDFEYISKRALREFYFPAIDPQTPYYEWGFLRKNADITLQTNTYLYTFPDDFGGTILDESLSYAAAANRPAPTKVQEATIRLLRSNDSQSTGWPTSYAVRNKTHDAANGQRWEMMVYPTPGATQNNAAISYRYAYVPDALSNTNKYPVGGGQYGEIVIAAHLAAAEQVLEGDPAGPFRQSFIALLAAGVRADQNLKTTDQGVA